MSEELGKMVAARKAVYQEKKDAHSKETLKRHLQVKFKTTMIGALSQFEKAYGYLWGHGKPEDELTEGEKEQREVWQLVRTEVLNNGNNQMRAALQEVDQNTIRYNKMSYDFPIVRNKDN